jgi:predicted Zn-dependent protease
MTSHYPVPTTPLGEQAEMLYQQGYEAYRQHQWSTARQLLEQSPPLYHEAQHTPGMLRVLHILGNIACEEGQYPTARTLHEEVLAACRAMNFQEGIASSLNNLGLVAGKEGQLAEGCALLEESIQIYRALGQTQEATAAQANRDSRPRRRVRALGSTYSEVGALSCLRFGDRAKPQTDQHAFD